MLPNLQSRTPVGVNYTPSLPSGRSIVPIGQMRGTATTTLTANNLAAHYHVANYDPTAVPNSLTVSIPVSANTTSTTVTPSTTKNRLSASPGGNVGDQANIWGGTMTGTNAIAGTTISAPTNAATVTVSSVGGGQAINNLPPEAGMRFCIATMGLYPPRGN